jgi:hypothetical protein
MSEHVVTKTFYIYQEHIDASKVTDGPRSECCPIALAVRAQQWERARVGLGYLEPFASLASVRLPSAVREFQEKYDAGQLVQPMTFKVAVPQSWLQHQYYSRRDV